MALAILNCGGYRYGASDQAFYIPAIRFDQNPSLFPRDRALLNGQSRLTIFDEAMAALAPRDADGLPGIFFAAFLLGLVLLWLGIRSIGGIFYRSPWTIAALGLSLTLRHRIPRTGANTLEGYLHPRMIAFALGVLALASIIRKRPVLALVFLALGGLLHPTTTAWFFVWAAALAVVTLHQYRGLALALIAAAVAGVAWLTMNGALSGRFAIMDEVWLSVLASKDYIFPTDWPAGTWLLHLLTVAAISGAYEYRRRTGRLVPGETGLVAGCLALFITFLLSLPFIAARVALAVQLQTSRTFWMLDFMATVYLIWMLCEMPAGRKSAPSISISRRQRWAVCLLAVISLSRGLWVTFVEHPGRPVIEMGLQAGPWNDALQWIAATPPDRHILADPGHAWRYGTSVRVGAVHDVYQEEVKDSSMALYSRDVAVRVLQRIRDADDFPHMTSESIVSLGQKYDLDYFVTDRSMPLPVVYDNRRFKVYALKGQ